MQYTTHLTTLCRNALTNVVVDVGAVTPQQEEGAKQELYRVWGRGRTSKADATVPPPMASSAAKLEMQMDLESFKRQASDSQE